MWCWTHLGRIIFTLDTPMVPDSIVVVDLFLVVESEMEVSTPGGGG